MKKMYLALLAIVLAIGSWAQNASVQIIHNSPTPGTDAGPVVDIYVNGALLPELTGVPFRAATPFLDVPAGADIEVAIAVNPSTSVADAIATFPLGQLADGENYTVIAGGIVGDADNPFNLFVNAGALQSAEMPGMVSLNVFHGSPDAPAVDVDARAVGTLIEGLAFGDFTADYLSVPADIYYLDVRAAGDPNIVATFAADVSGLGGGAATVFASGFLGDAPSFGLFAALADGTVIELPATEVARLQVIHNSPSPIVDIYAGDDLLLDDFAYRTATPFIFVPAGVEINLGVALDNSTSSADALVNIPVTFENGETYVAIANGIVGDATTPFALEVNATAREASTVAGEVQLSVFHGSPDAPAVDVDARAIGTLIEGLAFGDFTADYLSVPAGLYYLDVRAAGDPNIVATFAADVSGLGGGAATVFASGLLGNTPAFGLFAALADGTVIELPATEVARLQVIHNSPSPTVDIYAGDDLLLDDFAYRTATPFIFVPAGVEINLGVALDNSTSSADALVNIPVTFENGETYVAIANGIVGDVDSPFTLAVSDMAREAGTNPAAVQVMAFHGSPGAPDVNINDFLQVPVITGLSYNNFTNGYLDLEATDYAFEVRPVGSPDLVGTFFTDLTGLEGGAAVVIASGIVGGDPNFDLLAILPDGTVIPFVPVAIGQLIHNSPSPLATVVDVWLDNAVKIVEDFTFQTATPITLFPTRTPLTIGVAGPDSEMPTDILLNIEEPLVFEDGQYHTIIANGIPLDADTPLELVVSTENALFAADPNQADINVFHGSPGAPAVDVTARELGVQLVDGLAYGEFSGVLGIDPATYFLEIRPDGSDDLVATFLSDVTADFAGFGVTVVASGLLGQEPPFSLLAFDPLGNRAVFTPVAQVQVIHNSPTPTVDIYANGGQLLDDFAFRTATPFIDLPTRTDFDIAVAPDNSQSVQDSLVSFKNVRFNDGQKYIVMATGIVGNADTPFSLAVNDMAQTAAETGSGVDLLLYHGATDAPEVDVVAEGVGVIFDDVEYNEYQGYLNVPAGTYVLNVTPSNDNEVIVRSYDADVSGLEGGAATVFASGLLGSEAPEDAFEVWVALPDGTTFPLTEIVNTQDVFTVVSSMNIAPNPARSITQVNYTIEKATTVVELLYNSNGQLIRSGNLGQQAAGQYNKELNLANLPSGLYTYSLQTEQGTISQRVLVQ